MKSEEGRHKSAIVNFALIFDTSVCPSFFFCLVSVLNMDQTDDIVYLCEKPGNAPKIDKQKGTKQTLMDSFVLPSPQNPTREVFSCNKCHRKFNLSANQQRHVAECKNFYCLVCKKTFKSEDSFKKHKISSCPPKRYNCTICTKSYARKGDLTKHKKKSHLETFMFATPPQKTQTKEDKTQNPIEQQQQQQQQCADESGFIDSDILASPMEMDSNVISEVPFLLFYDKL